jgi:hypothetical protein
MFRVVQSITRTPMIGSSITMTQRRACAKCGCDNQSVGKDFFWSCLGIATILGTLDWVFKKK